MQLKNDTKMSVTLSKSCNLQGQEFLGGVVCSVTSVHCVTRAKHGPRVSCTLRDDRHDTKDTTLHVVLNDTYEVWVM